MNTFLAPAHVLARAPFPARAHAHAPRARALRGGPCLCGFTLGLARLYRLYIYNNSLITTYGSSIPNCKNYGNAVFDVTGGGYHLSSVELLALRRQIPLLLYTHL